MSLPDTLLEVAPVGNPFALAPWFLLAACAVCFVVIWRTWRET